jgi:hypothetical protein
LFSPTKSFEFGFLLSWRRALCGFAATALRVASTGSRACQARHVFYPLPLSACGSCAAIDANETLSWSFLFALIIAASGGMSSSFRLGLRTLGTPATIIYVLLSFAQVRFVDLCPSSMRCLAGDARDRHFTHSRARDEHGAERRHCLLCHHPASVDNQTGLCIHFGPGA